MNRSSIFHINKHLKLKKIIPTSISIFCISLILIILSSQNILNSLHLRLSDQFQGNKDVSKDIVIIAIDTKTISDENLGAPNSWSYKYYATVLDQISEAKVIGIDRIFKKQDEYEKEFIRQLKDNNVILIQESQSQKDINVENLFFISSNEIKSLASYSDNALKIAEVNSIGNSDIIRSFNFGSYNGAEIFENLSIAVSRINFGLESEKGIYDKENNIYYLDSTKTKYISVNGDKKFNIKFFSKPYGYQYYSFVDILNNKIPKSVFKNKIVLIGDASYLLQDNRSVPTSNGIPMPGVEIHANAIQTIIDQDFLVDQSKLMQYLTIFSITTFFCIAFMYLGITGSIALFILSPIIYTFIAKFSFDKGLILNMVYPYLAIILSFASIYLYRYFTEIKSKKQIQMAFSKYVNPELVRKISENPELIKLGGEEKEITVFFSDIINSTHISEGLSPEKLVSLLNEYFEVMTSIIMKNKGTLDKYEGDAIMAFWNAPIDVADHAYFACLSTIQGRQALQALHEKWAKEDKPLIDYRVGLNTGLAIIGNVGSKDRFNYTAMGDNINLGSRLESINKQYGTNLCISEATYLQIKDKFATRRLDKIRVKGKEIPVTIYELIAENGSLPSEALELIKVFEEGFEEYQKQNFQSAKETFEKVLSIRSNDGPSTTLLNRCNTFLQNPQPNNWDGVWNFETK